MYIRTKDGVYEVSHYNAYATHKRKGETLLEGYKTAYIKNENIIAQSENLEELCDGFYIEESEDDTFIKEYSYEGDEFDSFKQDYLYAKKHWLYPPQNAYGFIKTSKGLIYVAKMDDKGELELI